MKVRFIQNRTVQAVGGETFRQGEVYDLPEPSALRWIQRGAAKVEAESGLFQEPAAAPVSPPDSAPPRRRRSRKG